MEATESTFASMSLGKLKLKTYGTILHFHLNLHFSYYIPFLFLSEHIPVYSECSIAFSSNCSGRGDMMC